MPIRGQSSLAARGLRRRSTGSECAAANDIEGLQREARRIDLGMARGAAALYRCLASCSRMVVVPRTSGSMAGMFGGGGSGG